MSRSHDDASRFVRAAGITGWKPVPRSEEDRLEMLSL